MEMNEKPRNTIEMPAKVSNKIISIDTEKSLIAVSTVGIKLKFQSQLKSPCFVLFIQKNLFIDN